LYYSLQIVSSNFMEHYKSVIMIRSLYLNLAYGSDYQQVSFDYLIGIYQVKFATIKFITIRFASAYALIF
jgi:hypothetical protein